MQKWNIDFLKVAEANVTKTFQPDETVTVNPKQHDWHLTFRPDQSYWISTNFSKKSFD